MRIRPLAASVVLTFALAGCGGSPSGSPAPSPSASSAPPEETLTGTVSAGVEPHCLVLRDSHGSHSLYFDSESLRSSAPAGARVTVVGHTQPGMMTTCQQGEPFLVTAVRKN